jgi:hypothetical protein
MRRMKSARYVSLNASGRNARHLLDELARHDQFRRVCFPVLARFGRDLELRQGEQFVGKRNVTSMRTSPLGTTTQRCWRPRITRLTDRRIECP